MFCEAGMGASSQGRPFCIFFLFSKIRGHLSHYTRISVCISPAPLFFLGSKRGTLVWFAKGWPSSPL